MPRILRAKLLRKRVRNAMGRNYGRNPRTKRLEPIVAESRLPDGAWKLLFKDGTIGVSYAGSESVNYFLDTEWLGTAPQEELLNASHNQDE